MAIIYGTNNTETLLGTASNDLIKGFAGDDTITYYEGNDTIYGGDGDDTILFHNFVFDGHDLINGGNGNDVISSFDGNDTLVGGNGDDHISGGTSARIYGGEGQDAIQGGNYAKAGSGSDMLTSFGQVNTDYFGGTGTDLFTLHTQGTGILRIHDFDESAGETLKIAATFGAMDPIITSNSAGDAVVRTTLSDGSKSYAILEGIDAAGLEIKETSTLTFIIDSKFTETGSNFSDTVQGGDESETLRGLDNNDRLEGGKGDDTLIGGEGQDYLIGGEGADIFSFEAGDSYNGSGTRDAIKDFELGVDLLEYEGSGAPAGALEITLDGAYTSLHFTDADFQIKIFGDFTIQATANIDSFFV